METTVTPFLSSFFILLREGFEAMLIAILVFMYLDKVKANDKRPAVLWGIIAGIIASMFVALGIKKKGGKSQSGRSVVDYPHRLYIEIIAFITLLWTIRHCNNDVHIGGEIHIVAGF